MQYFIHGDDFGRTAAKTEAIDRLLREGSIQFCSLLVNLENSGYAVSLAKAHGYQDKVCFHLNLSEGTPLTEDIRKTGLCNAAGNFRWANSKRILATCLSAGAIRAIRNEAEAQIHLFRKYGFSSHRLDSHDWVLFNLPVWLAVKPLLKENGMETTRTACDSWIQRKPLSLRLYYRWMEKLIRKGMRMEETWAGGLRSFQRAMEKGLILPDTRAEIMTHPDFEDGELIDDSNHEHIPMREVLDAFRGFPVLT